MVSDVSRDARAIINPIVLLYAQDRRNKKAAESTGQQAIDAIRLINLL